MFIGLLMILRCRRQPAKCRLNHLQSLKDPMANILFVEDDDFIRKAVSEMIEEWGHKVVSVGDVEEALGVLASTTDIDVLITDVTLKTSTFGGYEISHRAIEKLPLLQVIYTSGSGRNQNDIHRSVRGSQFIQKPYREERLRNAVDALFAVSV